MSSQPQPQLQEVPGLEPDQLPRRAFFGYDRSTVVDLLNTMSARIRMLIQERAERDRRIAELKRELERNQESQQLIGETLIAAREEAKTDRERETPAGRPRRCFTLQRSGPDGSLPRRNERPPPRRRTA